MAGEAPFDAVEAERAVVGALLLSGERVPEVEEILSDADFGNAQAKLVYRCLVHLSARSVPIDFVSVSQALGEVGMLRAAGGREFLVDVARSVTSAAHVFHHARVVAATATARRLLQVGATIAEEAKQIRASVPEEVDAALDSAEAAVYAVGQRRVSTATVATMEQALAEVDSMLDAPEGEHGLATGIRDLDEVLLGLQPSDLIVLAARPSKGKTTVALSIAAHVAAAGEPVLFVSLEMSVAKLAMRMVCAHGSIDSYRIRSGRLGAEELEAIRASSAAMRDWPISLVEDYGTTVARLRALARRKQRAGGLSLVVVDYLQLLHGPERNGRTEEVSYISRALKALARELEVPVLALCQLSRAAEDVRRPQLRHLRESGTIEQDADVVLLLWQDGEAQSPPLMIDIAKNRNGALRTLKLAYRKEFFQVAGLEPEVVTITEREVRSWTD